MELRMSVKTKLYGMLDEFLNYDTTGKDFTEMLSDEVGNDVTEKPIRSVKLDMELYTKFVDQMTDHIVSGLETK